MTVHRRPISFTRLCLAAVLLLARQGNAEPPSGLRLERVDSARCHEGYLSLYVTDVEIDGMLRDRPASRYRLHVDGKRLADRPSAARTFADAQEPIFLALVIEASRAYAADLDRIEAAASSFVETLPGKSRVTVISYSAEIARLHSRKTPRQAQRALEEIAPLDGVDLSLIDALKAAIKDLDRVPATKRRMVVVVSDGINRDPEWDIFRSLGSRARGLRLPISPIGYSPIDERGPLLNLGELAKRSRGTFRWAKTAAEIERQLHSLGREISGQRVLTFPIDRSWCNRPRRVRVTAGGLKSNEILVEPRRSSTSKGRRAWLAAGGLLAVVLVLAAVTWLLVGGRRRRR